jgi:hypothetical protein
MDAAGDDAYTIIGAENAFRLGDEGDPRERRSGGSGFYEISPIDFFGHVGPPQKFSPPGAFPPL